MSCISLVQLTVGRVIPFVFCSFSYLNFSVKTAFLPISCQGFNINSIAKPWPVPVSLLPLYKCFDVG